MTNLAADQSPHQRQLLDRASRPDLRRWLDHTASTRGCVRPVRLTGDLHTVEQATGRIVRSRQPPATFPTACSTCPAETAAPACARRAPRPTGPTPTSSSGPASSAARASPTTVAGHPAVFATLTAPSFGPVHTRMVNPRTGKVRPCHMRRDVTRCPHGQALVCTQRHTENDPSLGRPICLDCYDHAAPRRLERLGRRTVAPHHDHSQPLPAALERAHGVQLRVSYGKVAEYQRRGVVHFHALIRLDRVDPADPDAVLAPPATSPPPSSAQLVADAVTATRFRTPDYADTSHSWPIDWGRQLDIRPRHARRAETHESPPRPSPPTWPSTPPRPPSPPGCRSPGA